MKEHFNADIIYQYIIYFTLYSVFGWCYEVFLEVVVYHWGFTNRGVLFGPWCPVYGFGAMFFLLFLNPMLKDRTFKERLVRIPLIFFLSMVMATGLELLTSYFLELVTGAWPWQTYVNYRYNFQGRIALSPSLRFGLGGIIFLYILQPVFEKACMKLGPVRVKRIALALVMVFIVDIIHLFL